MIYSEPLLLPCSINVLLQKLASCCSGELLLTSSLSSTGKRKKKKNKLLSFYFNALLYVSLESGRRFGKQVRNIKLAALLQLTAFHCAAQPGDYAAVSSAMQSWSLLLTTSTCLQNKGANLATGTKRQSVEETAEAESFSLTAHENPRAIKCK